MPVKYPQVKFNLSKSDGNVYMILGGVRKAMRRAGISNKEIDAFTDEAKSGNYDHFLQTVMKTVETE